MQITVQYETQVRLAAGVRSETVDVPDGSDVSTCVRSVAQIHGESLRNLLLTSEQYVQPSVLLFVNDSQVLSNDDSPLSDGDTLTFMTPISGG